MTEDNVIQVDSYHGISVDAWVDREGNKTYSLKAHTMGSGENKIWYPVWVFPSRYSKAEGKGVPDERQKPRPMSIQLGRRDDAIQVLRQIAMAIKEG